MIDKSKTKCTVNARKIAAGFGKEIIGLGAAVFSLLSIPKLLDGEAYAKPVTASGGLSGVALLYDGYNDIADGSCAN